MKAEADFLESLGLALSNVDTSNIVTITNQGTDSVDFSIKQIFNDAPVKVLSVYYHDSEGSIDCNSNMNVTKDAELTFSAVCVDGVTDVSVYVQIDGNDVTDCENCQAPSSTSSTTAAFYFNLDCEPICMPEGSSPTEPPTASPVAVNKGSCYDGADDVWKSTCAFKPADEKPIVIKSMGGVFVTFIVNNTYAGCTSADLSLRFEPYQGGSNNCFDASVAFGETMPVQYKAQCYGGLAEVELYSKCTSGSISGGSNGQNHSSCDSAVGVDCAHMFVLPCDNTLSCPTPAPTTAPVSPSVPATLAPSSSCAVTASLDSVVKVGAGDPVYPDGAVQVEGYADGQVDFSVTQLWKDGSISWVSVIVATTAAGTLDSCQKENGFDPNQVNNYSTYCDPEVGEITIQLNLHDGTFKTSNNKNPGLCDGWPTLNTNSMVASYEVKFLCPCNRRLEIAESEPAGEEPSRDPDDMPYCVSEDFPCEGDEANMVYVCHYSSRKGYQTFCVPEADSDILRFYAHDYCGPCEGGQGVTWGKMTN